ncbi:hypothetical protein RGQ15_11475 [Paracoccus sp. MBLB3053]|uniref:Uncharacterized protein n=1 Tax=Paracoccus aurantius TaxID=3073814 RepID=A0ABU2HT21_9RHOB|nr:hypothetical protein [Paracoccus sp. MBLB3053]MDS9468186.1 hypothetical protein [Paracoccus sp. MBLB3053]
MTFHSPQPLRADVLCESSGVMHRAFEALGHNATLVNLLAAEDGSNHHFVGFTQREVE